MKIFYLLTLFVYLPFYTQVGINTKDPKATLHVANSNSPFQGVIIPNISALEASQMELTLDQYSMLVYIKEGAGTNMLQTEKMKNVYYSGFYYWNNRIWLPLSTPLLQTKNNDQLGFRLTKNINSPYFGNVGNEAVDFSYAYTGTDYGAKGGFSFAAGISNKSSGERSAVFGGFNVSSGKNSMSWGGAPYSYSGNESLGDISTSWGLNNKAIGILSTAFGRSNNAQSRHETVIGSYSTDYVPVPETDTDQLYFDEAYNNNNRIFNVGIGTGKSLLKNSVRKDAFTILKNGKIGIGIDNFEKTGSSAKLQVKGSIKISGDDNTLITNTCDGNNLGKIIFVEDNFYGCKSTGWKLLSN